MYLHFVGRSFGDALRKRSSLRDRDDVQFDADTALEAASCWLMRSIDSCDGRGSSKSYRFMRGWMPAYPETSGYIIPTLLRLDAEQGTSKGHAAVAKKIGNWLVEIQLPSGGFLGGEVGTLTEPDVFDTGMIVLGFNVLEHEYQSGEIRAAVARACHFLLSAMDENGCFVRHINNGILHAYNVRTAWGLMAAGYLLDEPKFKDAADRNARWTLTRQNDVGYFANNEFKIGGNANTHGVAYVLDGLLEIYALGGKSIFLDAVKKTARALQSCYQEYGWIAAELGPDWTYRSSHICLTGYAQLASVFYRLYQETNDVSFRETADQLIVDVSRTQYVDERSKPFYGAIAGSFPIYGRYAPMQYPNWATKFFIDALLTKRQVDRGHSRLSFQIYSG